MGINSGAAARSARAGVTPRTNRDFGAYSTAASSERNQSMRPAFWEVEEERGVEPPRGVPASAPLAQPQHANQTSVMAESQSDDDGQTVDERQGLELSPDFNPHTVWQVVLSELALQMPAPTYDTWVRDTVVLGYEDGEFIIGMPNAYARDWLENRLRHTIKRTLTSIMRRSVQIQFRVRARPVEEEPRLQRAPLYQVAAEEPAMSQAEEFTPPSAPTPRPMERGSEAEADALPSLLNPAHTFDTYVVGSHNRLAHAAALAVVDAPGQSFNPLFIYSGVGLGKTHLLNAIGNSVRRKGLRMVYCSSETFTNELIAAIRNQTPDQFRNKYRQLDILLIDDIQFIAGKERTQEEFFHTFNALHAAGKQVVLSSDRAPKLLTTLDDRLRSRFEGGLQTDIIPPDFETRVAILQSKANRMGAPIPYDVLMLVAERVDSNIRELEGALNRLVMQARLTNQTLGLGLAKSLLENLAPMRKPCAPAEVIRIVAGHFGLRSEDMTGRKRTKEVANARQIVMYLLREENDLSLPAIGEHLGGRDHSTVRYGVERVTEDLDGDEALRTTIMGLRERIYAPSSA